MTEFLAVAASEPLRLHPPLTLAHDRPDLYQPPTGLREAIDVAMLLGVPLVLTGAPGTGKTQAAAWLAHTLGAGQPLRFDVKSTSLGSDLLYTFDEVGRFRDATAGRPRPLIAYLRFNALGEGILRATGGAALLQTVAGEPLEGAVLDREQNRLKEVFGAGFIAEGRRVCAADLLPDDPSFRQVPRSVRVVLVDELDKAPRDTPNDLLAEVETMTFLIPELGLRVATSRDLRPIVLITSNSEKPLPEAFLRRCAYFHVPRLGAETLKRILSGSVTGLRGDNALAIELATVGEALQADENAIERKPGAAELLAWSEIVVRTGGLDKGGSLRSWVRERPAQLSASLGALLKHRADQEAGESLIQSWAFADGT